jgi:sulfur-oxidizing protein SoxX
MIRVDNKLFGLTMATSICLMGLALPLQTAIAGDEKSLIEKGKEVAFDRKLGNCLACHMMSDGDMPGTIAPPLVGMKARFPDKAKLRAQIEDATVANPASIMPPFARHKIISKDEIDAVVEFVYSL